jgi:hypothetical protein
MTPWWREMIKIWERYGQMMLEDCGNWSWGCWLRRRRRKRKRTIWPERSRRVDTKWLLNDEKWCKTDWDTVLTFWCRVGGGGGGWRSRFLTTSDPIWTIFGALERYDRVVFICKKREADVRRIWRYRSETKMVSPWQKFHIFGTAGRNRAHEGSKGRY